MEAILYTILYRYQQRIPWRTVALFEPGGSTLRINEELIKELICQKDMFSFKMYNTRLSTPPLPSYLSVLSITKTLPADVLWSGFVQRMQLTVHKQDTWCLFTVHFDYNFAVYVNWDIGDFSYLSESSSSDMMTAKQHYECGWLQSGQVIINPVQIVSGCICKDKNLFSFIFVWLLPEFVFSQALNKSRRSFKSY